MKYILIIFIVLIIMANYGIKISKEGYDVETADSTQLAYSSKWSNFKIFGTMTKTITVPSGESGLFTAFINHHQGHSTFFLAFAESSDADGQWQNASIGGNGTVYFTNDNNVSQVLCDDLGNQFICSLRALSVGHSRTFTFKIITFLDNFTGVNYTPDAIDDYGIKISKPGKNVSDYDTDMSMTSKFNNLTIYAAGTITGDGSSGETITIAHNLDYVPMFIVLIRMPDNTSRWVYLPYVAHNPGTGVDHAYTYADDTNLYIYPQGVLGTGWKYKYIIFNEEIK